MDMVCEVNRAKMIPKLSISLLDYFWFSLEFLLAPFKCQHAGSVTGKRKSIGGDYGWVGSLDVRKSGDVDLGG